ncbi:hypothetical protein ACOMHN_045458 [Nucella lapillus]
MNDFANCHGDRYDVITDMETLEKVSFCDRDNMLLVHPATILVCGLAIGQLCVVNDCRVMTAWPCPALTPTAVFLPPFALEVIAKDVTFDPDLDPDPDLVVTVQRFLPSVTEAQQVDVWMERDSEVYRTEVFSEVLTCTMARKGILVFGPPGTGKSLLAEALANELDVYTLRLSPIDVFSKYFGETEKKLRSAFQTARQR